MGIQWQYEVVYGIESYKIAFLGALPIHFVRHFCCRMYRLATIPFVTDRQTDRLRTVTCQ